VLAKHTGLTQEKLAEETERDKYMSAEEAKAWGLIDDVLGEQDQTKEDKK